MKLDISVEGDSPIEIAMLLKGMIAKQADAQSVGLNPDRLQFGLLMVEPNIAQVGEEIFVWFDEAQQIRGVERSKYAARQAIHRYSESLNQPSIRMVECETLQENDFLELNRYGDCLHVLYADGVPVWCGHGEIAGRDEAQRRQALRDEQPAPIEVRVDQTQEIAIDPPLPAEPVYESMAAACLPTDELPEPIDPEESDQEPDTVGDFPVDENGYYWPAGTICRYEGCDLTLGSYARKRPDGYCSRHRNSK